MLIQCLKVGQVEGEGPLLDEQENGPIEVVFHFFLEVVFHFFFFFLGRHPFFFEVVFLVGSK